MTKPASSALAVGAAWSNAVAAFPDNVFTRDLSAAVSNDGSPDAGASWALAQAVRWIGDAASPIAAYDSIIDTVDRLGTAWPVMQRAADMQSITAAGFLPQLARFVFERIPAVVADVEAGLRWPLRPVTRALVIADRADTLAGMFAAGMAPNGSSDPYALRRAAKHFLWAVVPWAPTFPPATAFANDLTRQGLRA